MRTKRPQSFKRRHRTHVALVRESQRTRLIYRPAHDVYPPATELLLPLGSDGRSLPLPVGSDAIHAPVLCKEFPRKPAGQIFVDATHPKQPANHPVLHLGAGLHAVDEIARRLDLT